MKINTVMVGCIVSLALLLGGSSVFAQDLVYTAPHKEYVVTLHDEQCIEFLNIDPKLKEAEDLEGNKAYPACWLDDGEYVYIIGKNWRFPPIPREQFVYKYI